MALGSVYATTNDIVAISMPFRSCFIDFSLPPYSYESNKLGSNDARDILQISRLSNSIDDIEFLANTVEKYKRKIKYEGHDIG
jgi:hypothetical protein